MECQELFLSINQSQIALLRFILEGYDGLAQLSTVSKKGATCLIRLYFPISRKDELWSLLAETAPAWAAPPEPGNYMNKCNITYRKKEQN